MLKRIAHDIDLLSVEQLAQLLHAPQPSMGCSATCSVRLSRRRSPASYSAEFVTLNCFFGIGCRCPALCL